MQESRYADVGTPVVVEIQSGAIECGSGVYLSVSGATFVNLAILQPDGTILNRTPDIWLDTGDSHYKLKYILQSGDVLQNGKYRIQAQISLISPSGSWSSEEGEFKVYRKLGI